ncbi:uncharacterized protein LOC141748019 [Larus michahellis]|uniref:uncharacterized protein LOC141748019 n=1 Tax=Larus michahellis TaxID=119627 RepID=UPI003D9AF344
MEAPERRSPPPQPYEVTEVQALQIGEGGALLDDDRKMEFLNSICMLCRTAKSRGLSRGLDVFCHTYKLAENVKTLKDMDIMLQKLVLSCSVPRVSEMLQIIFQLLLNYTESKTVAVQVRALERIKMLSIFLANHPTLEAWHHLEKYTYGPVCHGDVQIPILGQLLGRLLLFYSSKEETSWRAFDALFALKRFVRKQKKRTWEFAQHLTPYEATSIVLVTIEAMRDSSMFDREATRNIVDLFTRYPDFWLEDLAASIELQSEDFSDMYQRHISLVTVSLFLRRLIELSERPDMVSGAASRGGMLAAGAVGTNGYQAVCPFGPVGKGGG